MKKAFIRLVDATDLLISSVIGWLVKEVLDYVKQTIWNRFQFKGKTHLKCLVATIVLVAIDRFLSILKWHEQVSKLVSPIVGASAATLLKSEQIPFFTNQLLSKASIFTNFTFEITF